MRFIRIAIVPIVSLVLTVCSVSARAASYYINCSLASNGTGTMASPWNSLTSPNAASFAAGDTIYFEATTTCYGAFVPHGSGTSASPISVTSYGTGAVPIIDGQTNNAVMSLTNQSYWTIQNLKLLHGNYYGLYVYASSSISGINVKAVEATGAYYVSTTEGDSEEVILTTPGTTTATISNSTLDTLNVHDSKVSRGIFVQAGNYQTSSGAKGSNITIKNSTVANVYGDGLLLEDTQTGVITANKVSKSGQCPSCAGATPVGIWVWNSKDVVMSWNESFQNSSWGADGGGIDIDFWNTNVTAEYNFSHDNKGYCVSVFGEGTTATVNSIVRYNLCVNNLNSSSSPAAGDIYLYTWSGGVLNGVQVYNNTSYFNPIATGEPFLQDAAAFSGSNPNFAKNNLVYSTYGYIMVNATSPLSFSNNLYYTPSGQALYWIWNGTSYTTLASWQVGSGQDSGAKNANPLLSSPGYDSGWPTTQYTPTSATAPGVNAGTNVCSGISGCSVGTVDFLDHPNMVGPAYDIGAVERQ